MRDKKDIEALYYLSPLQHGLLFHALSEAAVDPYFSQTGFLVEGALEVKTFQRAWQTVTDRHPILRTMFVWKGVEQPLQVVRRRVTMPVQVHDWRAYPEDRRREALAAFLESDRRAGVDFSRAPMMRLTLIQFADRGFYCINSHHHILLDGWSFALVLRDALLAYRALLEGGTMEPPPPPYREYIAWLQRQDGPSAEQFWRRQLEGLTGPTPLVVDAAYSPVREASVPDLLNDGGDRYVEERLRLGRSLSDRLRALTQRLHLTVNTVMQGAWVLLLHRYSGAQDIVFGATVSGRPPDLTGAEAMVGLFINTLPVRARLSGDDLLGSWLSRLQEQNSAVRQYGFAPLPSIQRWSGLPGGRPLFESLVVFDNYPEDDMPTSLPGDLRIRSLDAEQPDGVVRTAGRNNYPLSLIVEPASDMRVILCYDHGRFRPPIMTRMLRHYVTLLESMASRPDGRLSELPYLREDEQRQLTADWSGVPTHLPPLQASPRPCIHELFEAQARRRPDHIAVWSEQDRLPYRDLERRATLLAHALRRMGVGLEIRVGLCVERSTDMIVGILAVLKAGGAYVPLDPNAPPGRLAYMIADSGTHIVLTQRRWVPMFASMDARLVLLDDDGWMAQNDQEPLSAGVRPENLAYIIYTSGSTGRPKGVAVEHRQLVSYVHSVLDRLALGEQASFAMVSTAAADLGHTALYGALCSGRTLHVISPDRAFDPDGMAAYMQEHRIDAVKIVPSHLRALLDAAHPEAVLPARCLVLGGEVLDWELIRRVRTLAPRCSVINHYGPTETTVGVTTHCVVPEASQGDTVPIGRPLPHSQTYILDQYRQPVPAGVAGELYIGGTGVARGYVGQSDLTAERFLPDPFGQNAGGRLYRTGDRARYLPDGTIEFLGRTDRQVKLKGFRIELGEIEAQLRMEPDVRDAVVMIRDGHPHTKRLVAYVVPTGRTIETESLRVRLAARLPEPMVPHAIMPIPSFPLSANGKLDLERFPDPEERACHATQWVAPRNRAEQKLAEIWAEVLGRQRVGIYDNFFDLGGDSILSLQIIARAHRDGLKLTPKHLFEHHTIAAIVDVLEGQASPASGQEMMEQDAAPCEPFSLAPLEPARLEALRAKSGEDLEDLYPAAPVQHGMLFHSLLEPESSSYVNQLLYHFTAGLDVEVFQRAWQQAIDRHAILRTALWWEGTGDLLQAVHRSVRLPIEQLDWRSISEDARRSTLQAFLAQDRGRGFRFDRPPLMRLTLIRVDDQSYWVVWTLHHAMLDGWCQGLLVQEVLEAYKAGAPADRRPEARSYRDYIAWLQRQDRTAAERFWRTQLKGFRFPTRLPHAGSGQATTHRSAYGERRLDVAQDTTRAIEYFAQAQRVTVNTVIQAAWATLLSAHSGEEDVVFGATVAGRPAELVTAESMLGVFINTLPLRTRVVSGRRLDDWLRELQTLNVELRRYEYSAPAEVQGWSEVDRGVPLFESILVFQNYPMDEAVSDFGRTLGIEVVNVEGWSHYPLMIMATPGRRLSFTFSYDLQRFNEGTVSRLADQWAVLLEAMVRRADARIGELTVLTAAERRSLAEWNQTERPYPSSCLHHLIEAQAQRTPNGVALLFGDERVTYRRVNEQANQLAWRLRRHGVGPDVLVGLCVERSPAMLVGLLGILKAGGAYLPLDPTYPKERLAYMLDHADVPLLLTQERMLPDLPQTQARLLCLDRDWPTVSRESTDTPIVSVSPDSLAYVIYTSGSTGQPKGVMVCHRNAVNFLHSIKDELKPETRDVVPAITSLSFDIALLELFLPWMVGGTVLLTDRETATDGERLAGMLAEAGATLVQATPATWKTVIAADRSISRHVRILCGGEAFPSDLAGRFVDMAIPVWNVYGPTETTVWSAIHRVAGRGAVPLGRPLSNQQLHVLNGDVRAVPIGAPGELYIGGTGVSRGYVGRPDLTAERFIPDPFSSIPGSRLYKTGDLARFRSDGTLDYLGRLDHQVKIRGFRIELGEIEVQLARHPSLRDLVVVARDDRGGDPRLVAYVVPRDPAPTAAELREFLLRTLPAYMVPSAFVFLPALPLTPNNKVDRRALPEPDTDRPAVPTRAVPKTATEDIIASIWEDVLGVAQVGRHDKFFDLGGHSLLATQIMARVRSSFQVEVPLRILFEAQTVAALAQAVDAARLGSHCSGVPELRPVSRERPLRLSFAQQRLWFLAQLQPEGWSYNMPFALRLRGTLDVPALETSFREVIRRHEVLRTTFAMLEGEPVQLIAEDSCFTLPIMDLAGVSVTEREDRARRATIEEAQRPFDLGQDQPIRGRLLRMEPDDHLLLVTLHHIAADAWSLTILIRELTTVYTAITEGRPASLPALPIQYADFAQWQRRWLASADLERQLAYWQGKLGERVPQLEIPVDYPRPPVQSYRGARCTSPLPGNLSEQLRALSRAQEVTLFMLLLGAFLVLLSRETGQSDIVVGTDIANRTSTETEGLIGCFVNLLVLRTDVSGNPTFTELLRRVREVTLSAYAHQDLPFDKLVEVLRPARDPSRNPLVQVLFVSQNAPASSMELPGVSVDMVEQENDVSRFDLGLFMEETDNGLVAVWKYNADLFAPDTIAGMAARFATLLQSIVADPTNRVMKLEMFTQSEKEARMMKEKQREATVGRTFKSIKPKTVRLAQRPLVEKRALASGERLPLVIQPAVDDVDLAAWAQDSRAELERELQQHGALLFRGFQIASTAEFERFAQAICPALYGEYGDLPKEESGTITYRSTPYPPDQAILFHNESSHLHRWPMKQWFFCLQAATTGGETPIVDCRTLYRRLDPTIRDRFAAKGLMYVRNFTPGFDVSWQEFFQTSEKEVVEERCTGAGIEFSWIERDRLRTRQRCVAVARHPATGEPAFFNQIQLHHASCLQVDVRTSLLAMLGEEWLPRNVYYGDGSPIEDAVVEDIRRLSRDCAVKFPWRQHDILMVDNMLIAHGREPFVGPRKIVVAMGEMIGRHDIEAVGSGT